jgi:hypothetical protein
MTVHRAPVVDKALQTGNTQFDLQMKNECKKICISRRMKNKLHDSKN